MSPKIMIIGSDNTSDRFGAALAREILALNPETSLVGVGGPLISAAGVELLYDISDMASLGVFQSIRGSQVVKRLLKRVAQAMDDQKPDLVIQIGLPFFEFRLLEIARAKDIPVFYYYTPFSRGLSGVKTGNFSQVVNKVLAMSRFEAELCEEIGVEAEFVGHPLNDLADFSLTPEQARKELGLQAADGRVIAVLPGSREAEVRNVLPTVLKSLSRVVEQEPDLEIIVSLAPTISAGSLERIVKKCGCERVRIEKGIYTVLRAADLAITSVGTASLEASLLGIPSLAVYRVPGTTYFVDRLLDRRPHLTITNNILRKTVIPEYVQSDFGIAKIAEAIEHLLNDEQSRQAMLAEFSNFKAELGGPGSIRRAAGAVLQMIGCVKDGTVC